MGEFGYVRREFPEIYIFHRLVLIKCDQFGYDFIMDSLENADVAILFEADLSDNRILIGVSNL